MRGSRRNSVCNSHLTAIQTLISIIQISIQFNRCINQSYQRRPRKNKFTYCYGFLFANQTSNIQYVENFIYLVILKYIYNSCSEENNC